MAAGVANSDWYFWFALASLIFSGLLVVATVLPTCLVLDRRCFVG